MTILVQTRKKLIRKELNITTVQRVQCFRSKASQIQWVPKYLRLRVILTIVAQKATNFGRERKISHLIKTSYKSTSLSKSKLHKTMRQVSKKVSMGRIFWVKPQYQLAIKGIRRIRMLFPKVTISAPLLKQL